ncbi:MAG TPA: oxidoreductase [Rhodobiaceae bacterium]|nr:oxidoreductase [Rhodobiaceae bacterium]
MTDYHLVIDGATAEESWTYLDDDAALRDAPFIISLTRLKDEADALAEPSAPLGVILRADGLGKTDLGEDVRELAPFIDRLALIAIHFPAYRNGRGYSAARVLREEFNFNGQLRATGDVLYDQWAMMNRCGINAFELAADIDLATFQAALGELSGAYQPAADQNRGALWARGK